MDLTRPSSGHDFDQAEAEDPLKIHQQEEEEHHESRASRMLGKVKAKAKRLKNRLTKHGIDGNEHDQDVVDGEEEVESDEHESKKHVEPVNEVSKVSQHETLTHPGETNLPAAPGEIIPSGTKDSTAAPSYPVRTSDSRETHHVPLNRGEDEFVGGQGEVKPERLEEDVSGDSTYQSKIPYQTQKESEEAVEDDQKSGSGIWKDSPVGFGGGSETELPARNFESETGNNNAPTVFGDFPEERHDFDPKMESRTGNDSGELGTELSEDFPAKRHEFEQTFGSGIGEDNGAGKPGTERREDFLGKSYEFDQEIESEMGKNSAISDDMKVETGLPTGTDDHFSPELSDPKESDDLISQKRYEAQEPKLTNYTEMIGSETDKTVATESAVLGYSGETAGLQQESPVVVAEKLTTDDEDVKEAASPVTTKLPLSGSFTQANDKEQEEDEGVSTTMYYPKEKLTPEEEGEKKTPTANEVEVAFEKIPSDKLPEETEHIAAVAEEGKGGGGIVGTIKGVYNYWLGGTTDEVKPKSPNSVQESSQPLSSTLGSYSVESGLGETGGSGAVPLQKGL